MIAPPPLPPPSRRPPCAAVAMDVSPPDATPFDRLLSSVRPTPIAPATLAGLPEYALLLRCPDAAAWLAPFSPLLTVAQAAARPPVPAFAPADLAASFAMDYSHAEMATHGERTMMLTSSLHIPLRASGPVVFGVTINDDVMVDRVRSSLTPDVPFLSISLFAFDTSVTEYLLCSASTDGRVVEAEHFARTGPNEMSWFSSLTRRPDAPGGTPTLLLRTSAILARTSPWSNLSALPPGLHPFVAFRFCMESMGAFGAASVLEPPMEAAAAGAEATSAAPQLCADLVAGSMLDGIDADAVKGACALDADDVAVDAALAAVAYATASQPDDDDAAAAMDAAAAVSFSPFPAAGAAVATSPIGVSAAATAPIPTLHGVITPADAAAAAAAAPTTDDRTVVVSSVFSSQPTSMCLVARLQQMALSATPVVPVRLTVGASRVAVLRAAAAAVAASPAAATAWRPPRGGAGGARALALCAPLPPTASGVLDGNQGGHGRAPPSAARGDDDGGDAAAAAHDGGVTATRRRRRRRPVDLESIHDERRLRRILRNRLSAAQSNEVRRARRQAARAVGGGGGAREGATAIAPLPADTSVPSAVAQGDGDSGGGAGNKGGVCATAGAGRSPGGDGTSASSGGAG